MPFPTANRVLYETNPLDEVVCQIRFPPILRIDAEPPAGFQEEIRSQYPNYSQTNAITLPPQVAQFLAQLPLGQMPLAQVSHEFTSLDDVWKISLTRDFVALTCKRYDRWEAFRARFSFVLETMTQHYRPSLFTRIGLRFRNIFCRSKLGLGETQWSELLNAAVTGICGAHELGGDVENAQAVTVLRLPNDVGKCGIRSTFAVQDPNHEQVFMLDSDFFTEQQTEAADAIPKLNAFNSQADNFFRWCITEALHRAMRPRPVD